jgi:thiol-disulfide isomerase/thioredoxin
MTQSTQTTALRLNVDLPDSLFIFKPPEGAKETGDWTLPGIAKPDVVGKPAPQLQAQSLDGKPIDLESLHGKVVLLDFWASWCIPCRREFPVLEKLSAEFRDQGLTVIGLDVDEQKSTLTEFLKSTPVAFPIAASPVQVIADLSVTGFPTLVLIDREGNIASYEVGARTENDLRSDLAKLGVKH